MIASQEIVYLTIDKVPEKTRAEFVRDVACSVFFGYYDYREGYIENHFKKGVNLEGIYGFLDTIKQASEILTNYHNEYFDANDDTFESRFDSLFHKHNPYLAFDFTNLINDFHYHLKHLVKRYHITINSDFYNEMVPIILYEINLLCDQFIPDTNDEFYEDFYDVRGFSDKYIKTINIIYGTETLDNLTDVDVIVRYRDTLI